MPKLSTPPRMNMFRIILTTYLHLLLSTAVVAQVSFDNPPSVGATVTIAEDQVAGSAIYTLQATDPSGNVPVFTILTQTPSTPAFSVDASDQLIVPSPGLDAETTTPFTFTFRVRANMSTADSGVLTVRVTDVNDNDPVFQNTPYTGEVWKNDPAGTYIATVTAADPDISNLPITYSIAGAQTTFSVNNTSGVISLSNPVGLTNLTSPTVLQVQASDGGRTGTATVTTTIHDNPCSATPCQNGGTCNSDKGNFTCTCLSGYGGDRCQSVDYCYQKPCQNGGTCNILSTGYTCVCTSTYTGENCTSPITTIPTTGSTPSTTPSTTPVTTSTPTTPTTAIITTTPLTPCHNCCECCERCKCKPFWKRCESKPLCCKSVTPTPYCECCKIDFPAIFAIVFFLLCCLCIVVVYFVVKRLGKTVDKTETCRIETNKTDEEKGTCRSVEIRKRKKKRRTRQTTAL